MIAYLQSLLPRLAQYSKKLDDTAAFVDIPWAFIDETNVKINLHLSQTGGYPADRPSGSLAYFAQEYSTWQCV